VHKIFCLFFISGIPFTVMRIWDDHSQVFMEQQSLFSTIKLWRKGIKQCSKCFVYLFNSNITSSLSFSYLFTNTNITKTVRNCRVIIIQDINEYNFWSLYYKVNLFSLNVRFLMLINYFNLIVFSFSKILKSNL